MISVARWSPWLNSPTSRFSTFANPPLSQRSVTRVLTIGVGVTRDPWQQPIAGRDLDRDPQIIRAR